jgi:hypothetical protein
LFTTWSHRFDDVRVLSVRVARRTLPPRTATFLARGKSDTVLSNYPLLANDLIPEEAGISIHITSTKIKTKTYALPPYSRSRACIAF